VALNVFNEISELPPELGYLELYLCRFPPFARFGAETMSTFERDGTQLGHPTSVSVHSEEHTLSFDIWPRANQHPDTIAL
jgi:hypothetical protein